MKNKTILLIFGILLVGTIIADISIEFYRETKVTEARQIALSEIGISDYVKEDINVNGGFHRCLRSINIQTIQNKTNLINETTKEPYELIENITSYTDYGDSLNYCSEQIFKTEKDADVWEKSKLESIADKRINDRKELNINEITNIVKEDIVKE